MFPIKIFLFNASFIASRSIFNFEFSICHVTTWFNSHLVLWVEPLHLPGLWKRRYYVLIFSCDLTRLHSQRAMWLHGWFPVTIHHHPAKSAGIGLVEEKFHLILYQHSAKFGGHTSSEGRNILFLICHVTSCDQMVRRTCDVIDVYTSP